MQSFSRSLILGAAFTLGAVQMARADVTNATDAQAADSSVQAQQQNDQTQVPEIVTNDQGDLAIVDENGDLTPITQEDLQQLLAATSQSSIVDDLALRPGRGGGHAGRGWHGGGGRGWRGGHVWRGGRGWRGGRVWHGPRRWHGGGGWYPYCDPYLYPYYCR